MWEPQSWMRCGRAITSSASSPSPAAFLTSNAGRTSRGSRPTSPATTSPPRCAAPTRSSTWPGGSSRLATRARPGSPTSSAACARSRRRGQPVSVRSSTPPRSVRTRPSIRPIRTVASMRPGRPMPSRPRRTGRRSRTSSGRSTPSSSSTQRCASYASAARSCSNGRRPRNSGASSPVPSFPVACSGRRSCRWCLSRSSCASRRSTPRTSGLPIWRRCCPRCAGRSTWRPIR